VYKKYVCPFSPTVCGSASPKATLSAIGSTNSTVIKNLATGNTCFYQITATCGAPAFTVNSTSSVSIEYLEFQQNATQNTVARGSGLASSDWNKNSSCPVSDMPVRNQNFSLMTAAPSIAGVSGVYDSTIGGTKAFGTKLQGASVNGTKVDATDLECRSRSLYVAVTATGPVNLVELKFTSVGISGAHLFGLASLSIIATSLLSFL